MIEFNKPYYSEHCEGNIKKVLSEKSLFRGTYYQACTEFLQEKFGFKNVILTSSCTSALELVARLINITIGDEVIIPSYTYVSTANAFASFGAKIILADSELNNPNIDLYSLENLISKKTKAIVVVHYGGIACNLSAIKSLIKDRNIVLIEDAAHCIGCKSDEKYLGTFGDFAAFSFHETKNVTCGQGGFLAINNENYLTRALLLKENGTNRDSFVKGLTDKYIWLDVGSTFNLPELSCAVLYANLLKTDIINEKRRRLWEYYYSSLASLPEWYRLPEALLAKNANGHIFYILTASSEERQHLMDFLLTKRKIKTSYHYIGLHLTPYYVNNYRNVKRPNSEMFTTCLLRLPMYFELNNNIQDCILESVFEFYRAYHIKNS